MRYIPKPTPYKSESPLSTPEFYPVGNCFFIPMLSADSIDSGFLEIYGFNRYFFSGLAYPLAAQQFFHEFGEKFKFEVTQVIGLTNDDAVSKEFRPYKQLIERLNRTYKASYRPTNGFDNYDGANYDLALWVAYYNFLRPHKFLHGKTPVVDDIIKNGDNMPAKWQLMIFLGQQTILKMQVLKFCAYSNEFYCYSHPDILFEAFSALRPVGLTEGEMLVKVLKIKDFYEFNFCSNTIVSMWTVWENMSQGFTLSI